MTRTGRTTNTISTLFALGAVAALAGCSTASVLNAGGTPSTAKAPGASETTLASAAPTTVAPGNGSGVRVGFCPKVQLITNDETYRTYEGRDRSTANIAYQAALYDATRSCRVEGDQLVIDITTAGRLLAGPRGSRGGSLKMPIRVAVKDSAGVPYSKIETHTASIGNDRTSDQFIYRRQSVTIPVTNDRRTIVLVGFDEGA